MRADGDEVAAETIRTTFSAAITIRNAALIPSQSPEKPSNVPIVCFTDIPVWCSLLGLLEWLSSRVV